MPSTVADVDAGSIVAMTNVGRPAAAVYAPQGTGGIILPSSGGGISAAPGSGYGPHRMDDTSIHIGPLAETQAPWFGIHKADPDAHHKRTTAGPGIAVSADQLVSLVLDDAANHPGLEFNGNKLRAGLAGGIYAAGGTLGLGTPADLSSTSVQSVSSGARNSAGANGHSHAIIAYSNGITDPGQLLKTDVNGDAGIRWLTTNKVLAATYLDVEAGNGVRFLNQNLIRSISFDSSFPIQGWQINEVAGVPGKSALTIGAIQADELFVRIFVANETRVDRGELYLAKSYGFTTEDFNTPGAVDGTVRVYFEDSPALNGAIFSTGDWIMFNIYDDSGSGLLVTQVWGTVSGYIDEDPGTGKRAVVDLHAQVWADRLHHQEGQLLRRVGPVWSGRHQDEHHRPGRRTIHQAHPLVRCKPIHAGEP